MAGPDWQYLYVVARDRPDLYAEFQESFVQSTRLRIVLDRRGEGAGAGAPDERRHLSVDGALRTRGWARVRIDAGGYVALG